ncbi:MAG: aminoacetone oxidase family FAD-binding enzyme [Candidatus Sumerlaeaceae bacterium]
MKEQQIKTDIAIIGGGASGLAAAIFAATHDSARRLRIMVFEGATRIGTKILVSGGGRCNVTNAIVTERDFWSSSSIVVRNVLRSFNVKQTIDWFRSLGVELVLEEKGKYFPATHEATSVRDALVRGATERGCKIISGARIENLEPISPGFLLQWALTRCSCIAKRVILATGGLALPKSGSDGAGLHWMRKLGHTVVDPVPALVPLVLSPDQSAGGRFAEFAGISFLCRLRFINPQDGATYETFGPILFTHFGVSGPAVLDLSRHVTRALRSGSGSLELTLGHPQFGCVHEASAFLQRERADHPRRTVAAVLAQLYPQRFAEALAGILATRRMGQLRRDEMSALAASMFALPLRVIGDRGFSAAEVTAGGVHLDEVSWRTLESRKIPGLHLCGEILDVDGRLGGFNFQWAWSSAYVAARAAAQHLLAAG